MPIFVNVDAYRFFFDGSEKARFKKQKIVNKINLIDFIQKRFNTIIKLNVATNQIKDFFFVVET